ncbi:MAG: hypothetical protein Q7U88_06080 [Desulfocapsaceae bacterium]|nr:hypothetical protein [Desulfocapsaceae bacterium]
MTGQGAVSGYAGEPGGLAAVGLSGAGVRFPDGSYLRFYLGSGALVSYALGNKKNHEL